MTPEPVEAAEAGSRTLGCSRGEVNDAKAPRAIEVAKAGSMMPEPLGPLK
jgi:hypothetical protein